jgi:hypothetical protein
MVDAYAGLGPKYGEDLRPTTARLFALLRARFGALTELMANSEKQMFTTEKILVTRGVLHHSTVPVDVVPSS